MYSTATQIFTPSPRPSGVRLTLLELVTAVTRITGSGQETTEIVLRLLDSGCVRLTGNFRACHLHPAGATPAAGLE